MLITALNLFTFQRMISFIIKTIFKSQYIQVLNIGIY